MKGNKKYTVDEAIRKIAFTLSDSYNLYLYVLDPNETIEEENQVAEAWKALRQHSIGNDAIQKHIDREANIMSDPVRFIDRHRFVAIDTDDLPL